MDTLPQMANSPARFALSHQLLIGMVCSCFTVLVAAQDLPELDCVIEPSQIVDIGSATAGVLEKVSYDRGDLVKKNAVIARLESGTEQAAAELARVRSSFDTGIELRRTSAEFFTRNKQRSRSLTEQNAISKQQLDQLDTEAMVAELQVRQEQDNKQLAKLEYRRAREALGRRSIKSPIDGVVVERFKSVGEYVEDTAILRVAQLNPLYVETIVPVSYIGKIKPGMQAQVTPAVPGQAAEYAVVTRIDRVADAASGTFGVRLELDNPTGDIVTGVRCALQFDDERPLVAATPVTKKTPAVKIKSTKAPVSANTQSDDTFSTTPAQCFEAGPVNKRSTAGDLIDRLESNGHAANLREVSGDHPGQFFVLTEQSADRGAAQVIIDQLKSKNVTDTHLLLRGGYAYRISLGLYTSKKSAQRRVAQLQSLGFDVDIAPRSPSSLWLEVNSADSMDVNALRQLLSPATVRQVKEVPCATLQAFTK